MLPIKTIAGRIRVAVHDTDSITYDDDQIIDTINCGLRFIRRTIAQLQPELLAVTVTGTLEPGESVVTLANRPLTIVEVTAGDEVGSVTEGYKSDKIYHNWNKIWHNRTPIYSYYEEITYKEKPLRATNLRHIWPDRGKRGRPALYYRTGNREIHLFPIPTATTGYTVMTIDDLDELTMADTSPLLTDFDDFLVEYANIRLSIGNEYDVSQEQVVMGNIVSQIQNMLYPPPPALRSNGYWNPWRCPRRRDY